MHLSYKYCLFFSALTTPLMPQLYAAESQTLPGKLSCITYVLESASRYYERIELSAQDFNEILTGTRYERTSTRYKKNQHHNHNSLSPIITLDPQQKAFSVRSAASRHQPRGLSIEPSVIMADNFIMTAQLKKEPKTAPITPDKDFIFLKMLYKQCHSTQLKALTNALDALQSEQPPEITASNREYYRFMVDDVITHVTANKIEQIKHACTTPLKTHWQVNDAQWRNALFTLTQKAYKKQQSPK